MVCCMCIPEEEETRPDWREQDDRKLSQLTAWGLSGIGRQPRTSCVSDTLMLKVAMVRMIVAG